MWFGGFDANGTQRHSNGGADGGGVWEGCAPSQKKIVFSPSKWCVLMHSGVHFAPTVIVTMMLIHDVSSDILKLHILNSAAKR